MEKTKRLRMILIAAAVIAAVSGTAVLAKHYFHAVANGAHNGHEKAVYYCPMHPDYTSDKPGECPICHMKLVKFQNQENPENSGHDESHDGSLRPLSVEELMAMKPGQICLLHKCKHGKCEMVMTEEMARLGKCPHCGEDLGIVIKQALPEGYGKVSLNRNKQQAIGIKTSVAEKGSLSRVIRTVGTIAYDPELYQAQAEYLEALKAFNQAEKGGITEVAQQAQRLVRATEVRLKLMGLNEELISEIAELSGPEQSLLYAQPEGKVWMYAKIYEYELPHVRTGQKVEVEVPAIAGKVFSGTVRAIDPVVDQATRTTRIRVQLENLEGSLKPDMYVNVALAVDLGNVLKVPKEAVFDTGTRKIIFVDEGGGSFEPREVLTGFSTETETEIKSGLSEGEKVVVSGNFLIDSESRLKASLQEAATGHKHGA